MLRILAPTDFSTDGYNATLVAMQLAQRFGWELVFVHAMPKPPVPATAPQDLFHTLYKEEERKIQERLRQECQHLLEILDMRHGEVRYKVLVVPTPFADAMLHVIAHHKIDLVVMGSRGGSNLKKLFLGSNTLELMRLTPVPLLVIPSDVVFNGFTHITLLVEPRNFIFKPGVRILERLAQSYDARVHFLVITNDGKIPQGVSELCHPLEQWQEVLEMPTSLSTVADTDVLVSLEQHLQHTSTDLMVLFPVKKGIWEEFFSQNLTEELAAQARVPLLVIPT